MNAASPSPARKTWRRRVFNRYSLGLLALLVAAGGYWGWKQFNSAKASREQYNLATVQRGDIQDLVTATGTVQPRDYVDVGAQVSGQLKKLHVEVGSVVKQGDLLAEIDPTVLTATVDARRAGLRNQQATLTERESTLALAQLQHKRQKNLMAEDATTTEQVQQAEATLRAARAQIEAVKAQIDQTQSTLRADEANLNYARIYAPLAGTVVLVTARQGQTLNANQQAPTILRIADLSTMTVQTQVSEADVSKLRQGMEVYFTTLGSQGRRWYGSLRKVEPTPTVTNNVVLYNALFDVPNQNQSLMPSMTAQVFFIAAAAQDVLLVPVAAVQRQPGGVGRRGGAASGTEAGSVPSSASSPSLSPVASTSPEASRKAARDSTRDATRASRPASAPRAAGEGNNESESKGDDRRERIAAMSPEERRAYFESLTPEQRQAMRDRRRAEGGSGPSAPASGADGAPATRAPVTSGFAGATGNVRPPRRGTVKVIDANGVIEERAVELGITNRVQVQVLKGLKEGEQVIAGVKAPVQSQPASGGNAPAGGLGGMPSGVPGGGGGGGAGGGGRGR